jgi:hypothetical protein
MQKERLMNEFSTALNSFQVAQRKAAEKEKESVARVRAHSSYSQVRLFVITLLTYLIIA